MGEGYKHYEASIELDRATFVLIELLLKCKTLSIFHVLLRDETRLYTSENNS